MHTTTLPNVTSEELQVDVFLLFIDLFRSLTMQERYFEWEEREPRELQRKQFMLGAKSNFTDGSAFLKRNG